MKKFLIIVKFSTVQEFGRFYEQLCAGRVLLPTTRPLPDHSKTILKFLVPLIKESVLINGVVVSGPNDARIASGMSVDISEGLETVLSELRQNLAAFPQYRDITQKTAATPDDAVPDSETISGLEMEISDHEIEILENPRPIERKPPIPKGTRRSDPDELTLADDAEELLRSLRMENESDDSPAKVDLAHLPDFLLQDDDAVQQDFRETQKKPPAGKASSRPAPQKSAESDLFSKKESISDRRIKDTGPRRPDEGDSANHETGGVLFEDLKSMVEAGEIEIEREEEPELIIKRIPEKKDLTAEERQRAEPVGQFFMNLTKAMLRSGYYAPGHRGSDSAKAGLYEEFLDVLGAHREIMITNHHSRDGIDLMITGILDEPISIRVLVGPGVAELFVPKLSEYCERKQLLSFALKKDIQADQFYQFIDIMSDPKVDDHKDAGAGKFLTSAFIEHGITEISTVFVDDMVKLETDLPWRVEMAIHRLAKDLKVMPMFKGVSNDAIKKMKLQTVQDIIRPLKHPIYLNDFLVNCYLISEYVKSMAPEEIEEIVVEAFSIHLLLPTSRFTFKEMDHLKLLGLEHPENPLIARRTSGIKRILKLISRRVVSQNVPGTQTFLQHLYRNEILSFNELPADVQYMVNTMKMADDILENFGKYSSVLAGIRKPHDALVYLKCFRRTAPYLIDADNWEILFSLTEAVKKVSSREPFISDKVYSELKIVKANETEDYSKSALFKSLDISERPLGFIFKDSVGRIIAAYERADASQRNLIDKILNGLGSLGVDMISKMLTDSNDREVRKLSYENMIRKGDMAAKWAVKVLEDAGQPWFIHRNAIMILAKVSKNEADFACVRKFFQHSNPKIREEALNAMVSLKPYDGESLVLTMINDPDPKVRWRALRTLHQFSPVSESTMNELLRIITLPIPKDKEEAETQINKTVLIISAISAMSEIPSPLKVETDILETLQEVAGGKQSLWSKVKRAVGSDHETPMLKAAIPLLGKIGGARSRSFLKQVIRSHPDLSESINKALLQIQS